MTTDFENYRVQYEQHRQALARANTLNKTVVFDALAAAGITCITVTFDGEGDSGQIGDICAYGGENTIPIPATPTTVNVVPWDSTTINQDETTLPQAIEGLCYSYLEQEHEGWEINDGAHGEFTFDVANRSVVLDFNARFTEYHHESHSF